MVGDLGSQVEHASVVSQGTQSVETSRTATSSALNEAAWPDGPLALDDMSPNENPRTMQSESQVDSDMVKAVSELQAADQSGEFMVASNGDIVVGNRFWTVFCKEVCSNSAHFGFAVKI